MQASLFIVPVPLDDCKMSRDCVLVIVASHDSSSPLRASSQWSVKVFDAIGRKQLADNLSAMAAGLLRATVGGGGATVEVERGHFPATTSSHERCLVCMRLAVMEICNRAGVPDITLELFRLSCAALAVDFVWLLQCCANL